MRNDISMCHLFGFETIFYCFLFMMIVVGKHHFESWLSIEEFTMLLGFSIIRKAYVTFY